MFSVVCVSLSTEGSKNSDALGSYPIMRWGRVPPDPLPLPTPLPLLLGKEICVYEPISSLLNSCTYALDAFCSF